MTAAASVPAEGTDRTVVARLLAELGHDLFGPPPTSAAPIQVRYRSEPVHGLTDEQLEFVRTRLQPCPPELVTPATHRVTWTDSDGISNVAYAGALGAVVPIVARETTLAVWRMLQTDSRVADRSAALSVTDRALLADVTTDKTPEEILRTGVDAAARVLVQHAFLAGRTPYDDAASFAAALRDSGIFATVAGTWHWGLQASTYRRGLIPARLICFGGRMSYSADSVAYLRAMKEQRIAGAHQGGDDPSAVQYAALAPGEQPRCLAHPPHTIDGHRASLVTAVADAFVETFIRLLDVVEVSDDAEQTRVNVTGAGPVTFEVPDMTCRHCVRTITKAVAEFGVEPPEFDLVTKRVVATFGSAEVRDRSFTAIRARGYTVVPPAG